MRKVYPNYRAAPTRRNDENNKNELSTVYIYSVISQERNYKDGIIKKSGRSFLNNSMYFYVDINQFQLSIESLPEHLC